MSFGPRVIGSAGRGPLILAHDNGALYKAGGATIDWSTVAPVDGVNEIVTLTVTASSGNISATLGGQTATVAFDASADVLETALEALSTIGNGNVRVTKAGSVFTLEFIEGLRRANIGTISATGATVAVVQEGSAVGELSLFDGTKVKAGDKVIPAGTVISKITSSGRYGPADTSASDGRQVVTALAKGSSYLVTKHIIQSEGHEIVGGLLEAGTVFRNRLAIGGTNQPTEANFVAMFPAIHFVRETV
ncbi:MAG: hypothetical protein MH204_08120 [Fimbriimonadaceae bacterium]|nr:hypothetical protein [Fimbriimonadaceae bacterium]